MRILQLPSWYIPEGGRFCQNQSIALQEAGLEVHILANVVLPWKKYKFKLFHFPRKPFYITEKGVLTYRYYSWKYPFLNIKNIEKWSKKTIQLFENYIQEYGTPEIIHVHSSMWGGYAAALIKEKYGIPYVITEHRGIFGIATKYARNSFIKEYTPFLKKAFSNADYLLPVSSQQFDKMASFCKNKKIPHKTIPNIIDTNFFVLPKKQHNTNKPFTFVSVNGFNPFKGYEYLLPAFDILCEKIPQAHLRIVGEDFHKKDFQALLKKTKHNDKISFAGEVSKEEVRNELWNADAFVIASRTEAMSSATVEAMCTGLPVVGTDVTPKEVLTKECGYRIPVENSKELGEAMIKMAHNYTSFNREEISKHIQELVAKENIVRQLICVYNEIKNN